MFELLSSNFEFFNYLSDHIFFKWGALEENRQVRSVLGFPFLLFSSSILAFSSRFEFVDEAGSFSRSASGCSWGFPFPPMLLAPLQQLRRFFYLPARSPFTQKTPFIAISHRKKNHCNESIVAVADYNTTSVKTFIVIENSFTHQIRHQPAWNKKLK